MSIMKSLYLLFSISTTIVVVSQQIHPSSNKIDKIVLIQIELKIFNKFPTSDNNFNYQ